MKHNWKISLIFAALLTIFVAYPAYSVKYDKSNPTKMYSKAYKMVDKGQFSKAQKFLKNYITILGEDPASDQTKYIHGNVGKGTFTFFGGHDPEDYKHYVGDPQTDLSLHRNSPGYRLILNNVLFPAAKQKKRKT